MVMAMRHYVTVWFAWWRRSTALLEATGRRHWASIMSDDKKKHGYDDFFDVFHHLNLMKRSRVDAKIPVFNRGMIYCWKKRYQQAPPCDFDRSGTLMSLLFTPLRSCPRLP